MTREEFEKKYGRNGMVKVSVELTYSTVKDLMPYFEEHNNLRQNAGKDPETLEEYIEKVLTLGCKHFMLKNAEFDLRSAKAYYKKAE